MLQSSDQLVVTDEEKAQMKIKRSRGLQNLRKLAVVQLFFGFVACTVGVVSLVYGIKDNPQWPFIGGFGLWIGVLEFLIATFGILAAGEGIGNDDVSYKLKTFIMMNYVFSVVSFSPCILILIWSSTGIRYCVDEVNVTNHFKCLPDKDAKMATSIVTLLLAIIIAVFSLISSIFFCYYKRTFGFKSRRECRLQRTSCQMQVAQQQQQQQQQGFGVINSTQPLQNSSYYQWDQKY